MAAILSSSVGMGAPALQAGTNLAAGGAAQVIWVVSSATLGAAPGWAIRSRMTMPYFESIQTFDLPVVPSMTNSETLAETPFTLSVPAAVGCSLLRSSMMLAAPTKGSPQSPLNVPLPHSDPAWLASQLILVWAWRS